MIPALGAHRIEFHGAEIRFGPSESVSIGSVWDHIELAAAYRTFDPDLPILHAGTGMGWTAAMLAATFGVKRVHCYEASLDLFERAREVRVDGELLNIEHAALWYAEGELELLRPHGWSSASLTKPHPPEQVVKREPVHTVNTARVLADLHKGQWNVLLDVEGAEHAIVQLCDLRQIDNLVVEMHSADVSTWQRSHLRLLEAGFSLEAGTLSSWAHMPHDTTYVLVAQRRP